jgi:hypothetical protein
MRPPKPRFNCASPPAITSLLKTKPHRVTKKSHKYSSFLRECGDFERVWGECWRLAMEERKNVRIKFRKKEHLCALSYMFSSPSGYNSAELGLLRLQSRNRLKSAWEELFEKYGKDFGDEADEIDLSTYTIVVDNGFVRSTPTRHFAGVVEGEEDSEDEDDEGFAKGKSKAARNGKGKGKLKGKGGLQNDDDDVTHCSSLSISLPLSFSLCLSLSVS